MNVRPTLAGRLLFVGVGVILAGTVVAACTAGQNLRALSQPTPTAVTAVAPAAPGLAPVAPPVARTGAASSGVIAPIPGAVAAAPSVGLATQAEPALATPVPASVKGIVVAGTGRVSARPDKATVSAGVQTRGRTAQEAQNDNSQAMQAVIAAIKGLGIPDKDIQTNGVSLYPIYDQGQTVSGYEASNNVVVDVENVDQVGSILDTAVTAGANQATNVQFGFKDETTLRDQALAAAAADARAKANALAGALGLQITGVESVAEGGVSTPIFPQPRAFVASAGAVPAAAPIEPGQLDVVAQVTIVFGY